MLPEPAAPWLTTTQTVAAVVIAAGVVLGFLASVGVFVLPPGPPAAAPWLHPVMLLLGFAGGAATAVRGRQIDRRRWQVVNDSLLTAGERELAHREAERQRRAAARTFLLAPMALGYWLAYLLSAPGERDPVAFLLLVTPMAGFVAGLVVVQRLLGPEQGPV